MTACNRRRRSIVVGAAFLGLVLSSSVSARDPVLTEIVKPNGQIVRVASDDRGNVVVIDVDGALIEHGASRSHIEVVESLTELGDVVRHTARE